MKKARWTTLSEHPRVLLQEYSFGAAKANCVAVLLPGDKWLLMSPPPQLSDEDAQELEEHGEVVALLANNGFHHLGLGPARARFPRATTYARPRAATRIRKQGKDVGELEDVDALATALGDRVELIPVEGDKLGDVMMRIRSDAGVLLYVGDLIFNYARLPENPLARAAFRLTDSAPGLKLFRPYVWFFVKDRARAKASLAHAIEAAPPVAVIPAHGDVARSPDLVPSLRALLG